jgi:hypothetical protein
MAIRQLQRAGVASADNSFGVVVITNPENWTTQATETYNETTPAVGPVSWGTDPEKANLDREFDAVGSAKQHLGVLLTFVHRPDTFAGAIVKYQPTYSVGETPFLELWTHDTVEGWTRRRRLAITDLARSGDVVMTQLLTPSELATTTLDAVWITMAPTAGETMSWLAVHLYGDCDTRLNPPDCNLFSDPPDCAEDCEALFGSWLCNPDDPSPPAWAGLPPLPVPIPNGQPVPPFPFPPITVEIPMPTAGWVHVGSGWFHNCPRPTRIIMYFSLRQPGAKVAITAINSPVTFVGGQSKTITGSGTLEWVVLDGFKAANSIGAAQSLPPGQITPSITFLFTPIGIDVLALLDWEVFLWTYNTANIEVC